MKILLVHAHTENNLGDVAMSLGLILELKKTFPDCDITCLAQFSEKELLANKGLFGYYEKEGVVVHPSFTPAAKLKPTEGSPLNRIILDYYLLRNLLIYFITKLIKANARYCMCHNYERKAFQDIISADLIIVPPSIFSLSTRNGLEGLCAIFMIFYPIILAQMFNRPSVLLGISTGPSTSKLNNRWIVKILKNTPIFVRERYSLQWLVSIGIPQSNISLVPDFGFYWHKLEPSSAEIAFKKEYLSNSRLNIGVIINAKQSDMETYYMKTMASLCDFLIEHKNARILFLPLSRKNKSDADTISLNHLIRLLKRKEETIFVPYISSPVLFRDISRQLDLVISSRLHGIILSRPAPVVAITRGDTSYRLTGVMDKLGLPQFTSSLENESDFDNIKKLIDIALVNSVTIRSQQQIQIQKINEDLEKTMEILKTTIPY